MPHQTEPIKPFRRVRYFEGQLLTANDFMTEQEYVRRKQKLHNKYFHGAGLISGLQVRVSDSTVTVSPGIALDGSGNEIILPDSTRLTLQRVTPRTYISVLFTERETDPIPTPHGTEHTRVEESFIVVAEPKPSTGAVPIARLVRSRGRWRVDKRYKQPRPKRMMFRS